MWWGSTRLAVYCNVKKTSCPLSIQASDWRAPSNESVNTDLLQLIPYSTFLPEMLTVPQLVTKFPTICGTQMFSTMCMTACHLSLSWVRCPPIMFSTSHVNIMLPPIPRLWSGLLPSGFPTKTMLYPFLFSPMHATCHTPHPPSFEHAHFLLYITSITHTHINASWQHPFQTKLETALQWGLLLASTQVVWAQIQCVAGQAAIYSTFIFRVS